mgnify:CR=1 FL=1
MIAKKQFGLFNSIFKRDVKILTQIYVKIDEKIPLFIFMLAPPLFTSNKWYPNLTTEGK